MSRRLLGVDVDDTIVTMDWEAWKAEQEVGYDPLDYWRSDTLYDNLQPMDGVVDCLEKLNKHFGIVFVSRLKGFHHKSKVSFVKRHVPFMSGFVGTHEKWILNKSLTALIDDNMDNLKGFDYGKRIWFNPTKSSEVALSFDVWNDEIVNKICSRYL